jgi:diguanylate cyclase (GGDEF)-like protein
MHRNRLHVLLIEDDEDDQIIVRDLLTELESLDVVLRWETTYEGGRAALEAGDHDVCLMDFRLGARDGLQMLSEIDQGEPGTPVILLTGQDSRDLDVMAMEAGAADYLVKGKIDAPLLERSIRFALERQRLLMEMHRRSLIDDLTGVLNRRGFEEHMGRQLKLARRREEAFAVLFIDVDDFKAINDRFGHAEGDRALRELADLLNSTFRASDVIARLGGDEFIVVPIDSAVRDVGIPERRLQDRLAERNANSRRPYPLDVSIGIAVYDPAEPCPLWELVSRADRKMYERKEQRSVPAGGSGDDAPQSAAS